MSEAQPSIFISYARSSSREEARALKALLGDEAFLDEREIELGEDFVGTITASLFAAHVFIAFVDAHYFSSWYCSKEWALATSAWRHLLYSPETECPIIGP